ncbi:helix-turn-helix transcriptional regulator [Hymenobacter sp. 5414T-23]|jgi:transcriptional regulator with XRE-family HTH domain|uniref:helix-turn-helix transcriptional regulator n=1 Tax=Hymenobacter sp. 5414T-23 TaxID=2932252 RepID=UPI001FD0B467|nr:helix-turn-helix transcriptional regulator [Hymenobacter sp. 5414T-23]UOQ83251.1 helix-turn-helix transcriptional regulator [Hymenobacter sp. 5414T-23]
MLKEVLKVKGLKQNWLAAKLGVSIVTVSNWCSGKTQPNNAHMEKLTAILGVEINTEKNGNG